MTVRFSTTVGWLFALVVALGACPSTCTTPSSRSQLADSATTADSGLGMPLATLDAITGEVTATRGAVRARVTSRTQVFDGTTIETGIESSATITFEGGRALELGAEGSYFITHDDRGLVVKVDRGLLLSRLMTPGGTGSGEAGLALTILTPFGLTRVGSGEVQVKVGDGEASVAVKLGEIVVVGGDGSEFQVKEGTGVTLSRTGVARLVQLAPILIAIESAEGRVELKKKGAKVYVPVNARRPPGVEAGDALRVRAGAVVLKPGDSPNRLTLSRGAEVIVGVAAGNATETAVDLPLQKGSMTLAVPAGNRQRVALEEGLALDVDPITKAVVTRTKNGYEVRTEAGLVTVAREGLEPRKVWGGQVASIDKANLVVTDVPRQAVALPTRPGLTVLHSGLPFVSLAWDVPEAARTDRHRVTVAETASLKTPLVDGLFATPYVTVRPPQAGRLFWKVQRGETEVGLGSALFAREPKRSDLERPRNEVPEGPEKTTIFFQDKPPAVTFTWVPEEGLGAASFRVSVFREGQLSKAQVERVVPRSPLVLPDGTLAEGHYVWSVTPLSATGAPLKGGRMNVLQLAYDNAVAALVILAPLNGDPIARSVAVKGIAPVGSRVFVNNQPVALDAQSRFASTAAPGPGGRVVFRLVQGARESYIIRTLR